MPEKLYCVYILTNDRRTVLYTGVTSDLPKRVHEHRMHLVAGFTKRYNVYRFVWYECTDNPEAAIAREKQIKAGSRAKKVALIESMNPEWRDLSDEW